MRAFLLYIDDWLSSKSIAKMDAYEERGYLRLILAAAEDETCSIPDDDAELAIISLLGSQWNKPTKDKERRIGSKTSGQKLRAQFIFKPPGAIEGRLYNERLYKEWEYQKGVKDRRRSAGQKGAQVKWQTHGKRIDDASPTEWQKDANDVSRLRLSDSEVKLPTETKLIPREDDFQSFVETARAAGFSDAPTDLTSARFEWNRLDFQQKLDAVDGLIKRTAAGEYAEAQYRPLPQNYIKKHLWLRPTRARSPTLTKMDRAEQILIENLMDQENMRR